MNNYLSRLKATIFQCFRIKGPEASQPSTGVAQPKGLGSNDIRLPPYAYQPLEEENGIRLIKLYPGTFDDNIRVEFIHSNIPSSSSTKKWKDERLPLEELRKTLPVGWGVGKTGEGRYLFYRSFPDPETPSRWEHPDPTVDPTLYAGVPPSPEYSPRYEALSYAWGDPLPPAAVYVIAENSLPKSHIKVRSNLEEALRHLRREHQPRILWIDAICINQDDISERQKQVKLMGLIFSRASGTVFWLGSDIQPGALALREIENIGRQRENTGILVVPSPEATKPYYPQFQHDLPDDEALLTVIVQLLTCQYFNRVWIVQELKLARHGTVQCGMVQVSRTVFYLASELVVVVAQEQSRLDLLGHCHPTFSSWKTPSWVPDWSRQQFDRIDNILASFSGGMSRASITVDDSQDLLALGVLDSGIIGIFETQDANIDKVFASWKECMIDDKQQAMDLAELQKIFCNLVARNFTRERTPWDYLLPEPILSDFKQHPYWDQHLINRLCFFRTSDGDRVCILLGCNMPLILRPLNPPEKGHVVIGPCMIEGLMDAEAFLGPLEDPWKIEFDRDNTGQLCPSFRNTETDNKTIFDPRLGPLQSDWEFLDMERKDNDPTYFMHYRNKQTGKVVNYDPRMTPERLKERGVDIQTIRIV
ncbi:HET-domain-containing protein [Corynespora cassiicola Philippines]|uniref:HET-domain-containing protein n=1 Tax=Corynespora cassiicola Philippines TaxID=1448308 RepID=A0A2T2NCD4_CORCC|nr:HET-domain-containing protein [Corynespora cassiicola Philippines]